MSSSVEKIKQEIFDSADEEIEKLNKDTTAKISEIESATNKEIEKIKQNIEETGRSSATNESKRELGKARLSAKMAYLKEKENGINQVYSEGIEKLKSICQSNEYNQILSKLIISAGISLGGGELRVLLRNEDSSKVNSSSLEQEINSKTSMPTKITIKNENIKTRIGGAIVSKGDVWVDNTFEAIMARRHDSIRESLTKILFS